MAYFRKVSRSDAVLISVSTLVLLIYFYLAYPSRFFWDLSVYERAVSDLNAGIDPYRIDAGLPFVYHPLVLSLLALLNRFAPLAQILPVLYASSAGWFIVEVMIWLRTSQQTRSGLELGRMDAAVTIRGWATLLSAAAFGGAGVSAVLSGNLTAFMHFALIAAFLRCSRLSRSVVRYLPFVLVVALSLIKPYFLAYLLVPTSCRESKWTRFSLLVAAGALFLILWVPYGRIEPQLNEDFIHALHRQVLDLNDVGYSFFSFYRRLINRDPIALVLHAATSVLVFGMAKMFLRKKIRIAENPGAVIFLFYFVLTLASPRMKEYDFFPAVICFFLLFRATFGESTGIILTGLSLSWIPLLLHVLRTIGVAPSSISGASSTWQVVGLAGLIMAFACADGWSRIARS